MGKRKICILLVMVLMILSSASLVGCTASDQQGPQQSEDQNNDNGDTVEQVTIQWWTPNWDEPESREMAAEFEADNPGTKVELVITDWDTYKSKITTAISANNAPELYTVLTTDVVPFAKQGFLEPLDEWIDKESINRDDFLPSALEIASTEDKVYGLPFRHDGSGMYYNVDMLKAAGYEEFPETWDEFVAMCKDLTKDNVYGFAWPLGNQPNAVTRFVQQLYTAGGDLFNEDGTRVLLDSPEAVEALNNIVSSIQEGYASPNSLEYDNTKMRAAFGAGQLATMLSGPFDIDALKEEYPDLNFKTAVIPGKDGMAVTTANGWALIMSANNKNKETAAKLLAYLVTPENQARLTDSFPASKTALEYEQFSTEELKPFAKQLEKSKAEPTHERWAEIEPIIYSYMQQAVSGGISVEDACKQMTADINSLLES
jgi:multiple sugar transport system substrate-binding protein